MTRETRLTPSIQRRGRGITVGFEVVETCVVLVEGLVGLVVALSGKAEAAVDADET